MQSRWWDKIRGRTICNERFRVADEVTGRWSIAAVVACDPWAPFRTSHSQAMHQSFRLRG